MSEKITIVLASGNNGKVREFKEMLRDHPIELLGLKDFGPIPQIVEDGETFDDNAYKKAHHVAKVLGLPAIADDSGLVVESLDGAPGVRSARFAGENATDADNIELLLKRLEGVSSRAAAFHCVISVAVPSGPALTYEGRCEGVITTEPRGTEGFGYDPVFYFPPLGKTFAELTMDEKNRVSHRGKALAELASEFDKVYRWLRARLMEVKPPKPDHEQFAHNDWSQEKMV